LEGEPHPRRIGPVPSAPNRSVTVAVPVRDAGGAVVAAINAGAPTRRPTRAGMRERHLPAIRAAAREVERGLALRAAPA
jgi:DNA-binding IclR family transcriptional regulator